LDYVVHINNGSWETGPIVLRLLPGEETLFNLKVINHGEPSNISLEASDPLFKAIRLKKPDHFVVIEENIPVLARMPEDRERVDGEILLTSRGKKNSVPISLMRNSEEEYDEEEGAWEKDEGPVEDDEDDEGDFSRNADREDSDPEGEEDGEREEVDGGGRRINFTRQRDVDSYRAASVRRQATSYESSKSPEQDHRREPGYDYQKEQSYESYRGYEGYDSASVSQNSHEETDDGTDERVRSGFDLGGREAVQIVPGLMLIAISVLLVLTFYAEKIPDFPGALASSILIVTLIIYGAATLLKA
jgi:hypothetical protein